MKPMVIALLSTGATCLESFIAWGMTGWGRVGVANSSFSKCVTQWLCAHCPMQEGITDPSFTPSAVSSGQRQHDCPLGTQHATEARAHRETHPLPQSLSLNQERSEAWEPMVSRDHAHKCLHFSRIWHVPLITVQLDGSKTVAERGWENHSQSPNPEMLWGFIDSLWLCCLWGLVAFRLHAIWAQDFTGGKGRIWEDVMVSKPLHTSTTHIFWNRKMVSFSMVHKFLDSRKVFFVKDKNCQQVWNLWPGTEIRNWPQRQI